MSTTVGALPNILDPMYWVGPQGLFASAVLPTILVIVFVETGLLFPLLPGDSLRFSAGNLARARVKARADLAAVIRVETHFDPYATSSVGARGLMQLMPATAQRFGARLEKLNDPKENLEAGIRYLSWLAEQFPNDLSKVLAAYNAGENAVVRYGGIPPYRETRDYVKRIYTTLGLAIGKM